MTQTRSGQQDDSVFDQFAGVFRASPEVVGQLKTPSGKNYIHECAFWERISLGFELPSVVSGDQARAVFNQMSALTSMVCGVTGLFQPRFPPAWLQPAGADGATSVYDIAPDS